MSEERPNPIPPDLDPADAPSEPAPAETAPAEPSRSTPGSAPTVDDAPPLEPDFATPPGVPSWFSRTSAPAPQRPDDELVGEPVAGPGAVWMAAAGFLVMVLALAAYLLLS